MLAEQDHRIVCANACCILAAKLLYPNQRHPVRHDEICRVDFRAVFRIVVRFHHHMHRGKADVTALATIDEFDHAFNDGSVIANVHVEAYDADSITPLYPGFKLRQLLYKCAQVS